MSSTPIWQPSDLAVQGTGLTIFTQWLKTEQDLGFEDYAALHSWSVTNPGEFWAAYAKFTGIVFHTEAQKPVDQLDKFPGAQWFPGATLNFAENLLQERSDKIAFVSLLENGNRQTYTYQQVTDATACIAHWQQSLGLEMGDRVAAWLPNIPETAVAMLGTSSWGGVWSSCSPDFGAEGALDRFGQIEPKVLFACDGYFYAGKTINIVEKVREVARQVPSIQHIVWVSILDENIELQGQETLWQELITSPPPPLEFTPLPFDHPLYILYSSGTTGKPKCIVHGQGGTLLQHKKEHQLHIDIKPSDTLFFFTTCGWMMWNWLVSALASRCTIVLFDGSPMHPSPNTMFDICDQEQVDVFGISAKFLSGAQKADVQPRQSHQLTNMRTLISTGSPLTHEGFKYVYEDIKTDCHLISMSGGTDLISCFMLGNPNQGVYEGELQSPGLGMAVDIWDENGQSVQGQKGELVCTVAFPSAPIGFWNDPHNEKYLAAYFDQYPNVWVHGDYAELTKNGGYIIHGRSDAVLNPGGVRIGTAEIYRQVEQFDAVLDAVCVGQDWDTDVRVVLFVVLQENSQLDEQLTADIKLQIRNFASPRHVPAKVIQVADIPRTMSGKIAELAVRDTIHGRQVKNTSALANPEALAYFKNLTALED